MPDMRAAAGLLAFCLTTSTLAGEPNGERAGSFWWGGLDIGFASLSRTYSITPETRDTKFALAFRGGYAWHPRLLLGFELGGWLLQATDYEGPGEGEGIQTFYGIAQFYPVDHSALFLKAGWGHVRYWNNRPQESNANGSGGVVGVGYDFAMSKSVYVTPAIDYSWGEFDGAMSPPGITQDQRYKAVTFRLGVTFR